MWSSMDRPDRSSIIDLRDDRAAKVARTVEQDFADLVNIFERQLDILPREDAATRRHVTAARRAAQRGLKLSRDLISRLQD